MWWIVWKPRPLGHKPKILDCGNSTSLRGHAGSRIKTIMFLSTAGPKGQCQVFRCGPVWTEHILERDKDGSEAQQRVAALVLQTTRSLSVEARKEKKKSWVKQAGKSTVCQQHMCMCLCTVCKCFNVILEVCCSPQSPNSPQHVYLNNWYWCRGISSQ